MISPINTFSYVRHEVTKPLQAQFTGKGSTKGIEFYLVKRGEKSFIYRCVFGDKEYYEVFKRKVHSQFNVESYPSGEAFGHWAWTYPRYEQALEKFNTIEEEV